MKVNKLDQYIRNALQKTFTTKKIFISTPSSHVNKCLTNLNINKQLLI